MTNPSSIEQVVMRRVRIIRVLRVALSNGVIALAVSLLALWGIGREVWVAKVLANGPQGLAGRLSYLLYAFDHTRLIVQVLALVTIAGVLTLARETARALEEAFTLQRASL